MLTSLFSGGTFDLIPFLARLFVIIFCLSVHECAHAYTAYKLGDNTARYQGRLTLNPIKHIDPVGFIAIMIVGFGWAKPVPINPLNFRDPKKGMAISAAAGPISNLLMTVLFMIVCKVIEIFSVGATTSFNGNLILFFYYVAYINVVLAIFNLVPVPPLDGSRLLTVFLPNRLYYKVMQYEQFFFIIIIVLLATGILSGPISYLSGLIMNGLSTLFKIY